MNFVLDITSPTIIELCASDINQNTTIEVYNYLGDLCDAFHNMNPKHAQFDVSKLPSGIYILKLTSDEFILQKEFIKY